jgi:ribosome modulation factor
MDKMKTIEELAYESRIKFHQRLLDRTEKEKCRGYKEYICKGKCPEKCIYYERNNKKTQRI